MRAFVNKSIVIKLKSVPVIKISGFAANTAEGGIAGALETVGDAVGTMMAYFTALIERRDAAARDLLRTSVRRGK